MENPPSHPTSAARENRKHRLAECYKRGLRLSTGEKNYDYAHAMFTECVLNDPGNLQFVEAMVQNLRASMPHAKKWRLRRGGSRALKKALKHREWANVLRTGIELLKADPWDVVTLRAMAEACAALHHNEVELVYLKQALDAKPKNVDVIRHCALSLGRIGQFDQAVACWHRIETLRGKDDETTKMISILAEEKLKYPGGRPPGTKPKEAPAAEPELEETTREVVLSPQQKLEQAIASDPKNSASYLELAELLLESNQLNAAESLLNRAIANCGDQQVLTKQLEQVRQLRAEQQRLLADERKAEEEIENTPLRFPWLELALGLGFVVLVLQLVPSVGTEVLKGIDIRNWSRLTWFVVNIIVLLGLIAVRYAPTWRAHIQRRARHKRRIARAKL